MRVLVVNNFVRQGSGIDTSVGIELRALTARGHDVLVVRRDNVEVERASLPRRAALLASPLYSVGAYRDIDRLLTREHVDVVHVHNLVPFITGAVYDACRKRGVPTVQHLRNYRAFCLSSYGFRAGRPCDECVRTAFVACAAHRCYRDSYIASIGLVAARWIDWSRGRRSGYGADSYVANSSHTKQQHVAHGLAADRIQVVHNPAEDLATLLPAAARARRSGMAKKLTFVGTLIPAKGPWVVLDLATALPDFRLSFIGTGDDEQALRDAARRRRLSNVAFHGHLQGDAKVASWADTFLTVVPSLWQEPFGLVVPESYSLGVPVLATMNGGLAETVVDGELGLRLDSGRIDDAASRVRELWEDRPRYLAMRAAVRAEYEARYTAEIFIERLEKLLLDAAEKRAPSEADEARAGHEHVVHNRTGADVRRS